MSTTTTVKFLPQHVRMKGTRGDGVPFAAVTMPFTRADITAMDASEWTAAAVLRTEPDASGVVHTFTVGLDDDAAELLVTLPPLTGAQTTALGVGVWRGDVQLTRTGEQPLTVATLELVLVADYTRPA